MYNSHPARCYSSFSNMLLSISLLPNLLLIVAGFTPLLTAQPQTYWHAFDSTGETYMHAAARANDCAQITSLAQLFPFLITQQSKTAKTPLFVALMCGNIDAAACLLSLGADKTRLTETVVGGTPLHLFVACEYRPQTFSSEVLNKLYRLCRHTFSLSGDVDKAGRTLLMLAAATGKHKQVKWLLDYGVDIYKFDRKRKNALQYAFAGENCEIIISLCNMWFPEEDEDDKTALHYAAEIGDTVSAYCAITQMKANDIPIDAVDCKGKTACDIARASRHDTVIKLIEAYHTYCAVPVRTRKRKYEATGQ